MTKPIDTGTSSGMFVFADWLDERSDSFAWDVRSTACLLAQVEEVCREYGLTLEPTGSRVYGAKYARPYASDWDWFVLDEGDVLHKSKALYMLGWRSGNSAEAQGEIESLRKGQVNLIILSYEWQARAFRAATKECLEMRPNGRPEVVEVFKRHLNKEEKACLGST